MFKDVQEEQSSVRTSKKRWKLKGLKGVLCVVECRERILYPEHCGSRAVLSLPLGAPKETLHLVDMPAAAAAKTEAPGTKMFRNLLKRCSRVLRET